MKNKKQTASLLLKKVSDKQLGDKLAEGYRAMAEEDRETAERQLPVFKDTLK